MLEMVKAMGRLGTESAFEVLARADELTLQGKDIINLGIGQPDFKTPEHIVEAAVKALRDGEHGYTPANGIPKCREAVAAYIYESRGVNVDPGQVIIVPGGKVTMFFAILMFGGSEAEIIYPNPGFPIYESVIKFSGAKAVPMSLHETNSFSFSADEVLGLINSNTRLLIINSPANPTGGYVLREELDKLVSGLEKFPQVAVLSDEIYSRMLYGGRQHVSFIEYESLRDRLILLDGWSKTYAMTGWRIGYGIWPKKLVEPATRLSINCHSCVNAPSQYAGIAALEGPQNSVADMLKAFDERRRSIMSQLNEIPGFSCVEPVGAFYAFPNISQTGVSAKELQDRFLSEAGVATIAGGSFGDRGEGYLRFSYANSLGKITEAINRIRGCL